MSRDDAYKPIEFDAIRIGICSPDKILKESHGEVKKPETINYRTLKPEKDGLYCERIFGPTKDWECHCGKYKKIRYKGVICDKCGVEVTRSSVRRSRIGHISLAAPVSHIWYFKGIPSRIGLILNMTQRNLEKVLYFAAYVVLDPGATNLHKLDVLTERDYEAMKEEYGKDAFRVGMGAEAIRELLCEVDLLKLEKELKDELADAKLQKRQKLVKRLEVVEAFIKSGNRPEWMILTVLPVLPPDLRPMVQLDGGRFATSDLNDLYRRIINRNNRLAKLLELGTPDIIVRNEKRMLQEAVDALIDNGRRGRAVTGPGSKALKSLSDMLKGKQGRFRQNLLGKRVDFSGRSVIVVGPELKIYQCGIPKEMAIELFKPFVMRELNKRGITSSPTEAKRMVERQSEEVWDILADVIEDHPVLLNRAPTLHRLGIQAFEPKLVEGKAIKLHPLVCTAFNADFDGDQMAIHIPLSLEAQAESRFLMLSTNNLLKPSDGGVVAVPTQDMLLGIYYLTQERKNDTGIVHAFKSYDEALMAYENKTITLQERIRVRVESKIGRIDEDGKIARGIIETSVGRLIFNEIIPQDLGFVDRTKPENEFLLEVNGLVKKGEVKRLLERIMDVHGPEKIALVLDDIKTLGYKYSTKAAMTVSIDDIKVPESRERLLSEAEDAVETIRKNYRRGLLTEDERYRETIGVWEKTDKRLHDEELFVGLSVYNNIYMMADSGARGSRSQIKQLAAMRGLMANTTGKTIELPIKSNFRQGLNVLEYFISAHGARKGLSDTALRTADSGYLTRRLVDIAHDLIIKEDDCCHDGQEIPYMEVHEFRENQNENIESLKERITGRVVAETIVNSETGETIIEKNELITKTLAEKIIKELNKSGRESIKIRTVLSCKSKDGICAHCYGANMATGQLVGIGEAVGVVAAQSIGEPGTQLTMRTFHTGGVAGGDITQGLPRVEELFEARRPKGMAIVTEYTGTVKLTEEGTKRVISIIGDNKLALNDRPYLIPFGSLLKVKDGDKVSAGDPLTEGSIDPHDILNIQGVRKVQDYLLKEVQKVYRKEGVDINDKHIEMIVRQMMRKMYIVDPGDSDFLPDTAVDIVEFEETNEKLISEGKKPAVGKEELKGITKASLTTESFLSAASFQETTRVLTEASINGKIDRLQGLKENVIIGRTIPTGTGMRKYQNTLISTDMIDEDDTNDDTFELNPDSISYEAKEYKVQNEDLEE